MRMVLLGVALWSLPACLLAGPGAAASLTYTDGICAFRVVYDRAKVDGARLKATFDYLADPASPIELAPAFTTPEEIAAIDVPAYRARCAAHRKRLADVAIIDDADVAALRRHEIADLDATCTRVAASLAAAKGDVAPARALAPSCGRYVDLLALPAQKLKAQWNDLVIDLCRMSTEINVCAGHLQRSGEGPGSATRRLLAVLERWAECAKAPDAVVEGTRSKLLERLAKRYRAKILSCAN